MKLKAALLVALTASSCSLLTSKESDPYRMIPRGREVKLVATSTCEIVCAEVGETFYFVAREAPGSSDPGPWLTTVKYVRWVDHNRNGVRDAGEPSDIGSREGAPTSLYTVRVPDPIQDDSDAPHLIVVDYVSHGRRKSVGPRRLP